MGYCGTVQMVLDKSLKKILKSNLIVGAFSKKFEVKQNWAVVGENCYDYLYLQVQRFQALQ